MSRQVRRLAAIALCVETALPSTAAAAERTWAEPQIETVVKAGLLADSADAFKPQKPLTQRALGAALETLSLASSEEPVVYRYPVAVPGRAVTIRELDASLVGFLGLGDYGPPRSRARSATRVSRRRQGTGRRPSPDCSGSASTIPPREDALELGLNDVDDAGRGRLLARAPARALGPGAGGRSGRQPSSSSSPC